MKKKLNIMGLNNVEIMLNFKDLRPVEENQIRRTNFNNIRVCTFSRVIKEKGIENAINVVSKVNRRIRKKCILS